MKHMKSVLCIVSAVLLCTACICVCAAADAQPNTPMPGFGAYDHVFIVGVDGAGAAFEKTDTPCFDAIFSDYAYRHDAATEYDTTSAPNWGSILTGVPYDVHGFTNDSIEAAERDSTDGAHTLFYYVRQAVPEAQLASFVNWAPLNYGLIENDLNVEKRDFLNDDPGVTAAVEEYFAAGNAPTLMFVQLDNVDHAAHGYGGFSEEYYAAVRTADAQIGRIYSAVEAQGLMENGLFIVVADHGETAGGHGGHTQEESSAVVALAGHNVNRMQLPGDTRDRDVAATVLYALGIEQPECFQCSAPGVLFGEERWHPEEPSTEPTTEPPTEPTTEPVTEPASEPSGNNNSSGKSLWQTIIEFFQRIADFIRRLIRI